MDAIDAICNRYVSDLVAHSPMTGTGLGRDLRPAELDDLSPDGLAELHRLTVDALAAVRAAAPASRDAEIAAATFIERSQVEVDRSDAGLVHANLNVMHSPVQELRQVFDLMPTDTDDEWANIAARLRGVPAALQGYRRSLLEAAGRGVVSARRQAEQCAMQCDRWAGVIGHAPFFTDLVARSERTGALRADLNAAAVDAAAAYAALAVFLRSDIAPVAPAKDAVGEDVYRLESRYFTGAELDLQESYAWAWEEFAAIRAEMAEVAGRLRPGLSLADTAVALDQDDAYVVSGQAEFRDWMQHLSDTALAAVADTHFDIPEPIRALQCRIAPPGGNVGAYYIQPSDDLSRPGAMWWSVTADTTEFQTWRQTTTVFHEGVPGHHLQLGTAVYARDTLNDFERLLSFTSGHGEGWALYAERLMRELGHFGDDGDLLGLLDSQLFRTARIILDIGMHLELEIPAGTGFHEGERWTPELGLEFLLTRTLTADQEAHDEIDRYLGWPGQAPAYKLGERIWLQARADAQARHGAAFDLKAFHTAALNLGSMGLDPLVDVLATL
jgi:uncharacterized protein (DUF885 family)